MRFKCGIIGLPNVGKSTLFNILTFSSVKAENFPFCTIKSNRGLVFIVDDRLLQLSKLLNITRIIYGSIEFVDIAGLIKGASQGEGLGNSFLSDIAEVDILCHVVRCFNKPDIYHVSHEVSPEKDTKIIHNELILSDIIHCERMINLITKNRVDNNSCKVLKILKKCLIHLNNEIMLNNLKLNVEEKNIVTNYKFLTFKPIIYVANINDSDVNNEYLSRLSNLAISENIPYFSICCLSKSAYKKLNIHNKIFVLVGTICKILQLKTFFTTNMKEVRAWIVTNYTNAMQAANMVHSDFKKYFIRVEVVRYNDFVRYQGWKGSKKFGKVKYEGKDYLIEDGDILNFLI